MDDIHAVIESLLAKGLIEEKYEDGELKYRLTEKGRKVIEGKEKVRVLCPKHNVAALLTIKEIKGKKYYYARHRWQGKLCEFYVGKVEG
jgi:hypothetical protein